MMEGNMQLREDGKMGILDIPTGWGYTVEDFRGKVISLVCQQSLRSDIPKYIVSNPDGSVLPFYPTLSAVASGVVTKKEIHSILHIKFLEKTCKEGLFSQVPIIEERVIEQVERLCSYPH